MIGMPNISRTTDANDPAIVAKIEALAQRMFQGEIDLYITEHKGWDMQQEEYAALFNEMGLESQFASGDLEEHCLNLAHSIVIYEEFEKEIEADRLLRRRAVFGTPQD
ncbi:MAG: hypothetical protein WDN46_22825 [Methylocella sp.]